MIPPFPPDDLGDPDLRLGGLRLWVHGREHPRASDAWDGNWLDVTAHCLAPGASVCVRGPILRVADLERFAGASRALWAGERSAATLESYEPTLSVIVEAVDRLGHLRVRVSLTADHLAQEHRMDFEVDQTVLPAVETQVAWILRRHPARGR